MAQNELELTPVLSSSFSTYYAAYLTRLSALVTSRGYIVYDLPTSV